MAIKRGATFTNTSETVSLTIDSQTDGIVIDTIEGIYSFDADVITSPYSQTNGDRYKSSRAVKRNIVASGVIAKDYWSNRQLLYRVFRIGANGRFCYTEKDRSNRYADYFVESCEVDQSAYRATFQISLICPDPFFYDGKTQWVDLAGWISDFEFVHEFDENGEELGHRETSMIKEIENLNGVDGIGLTITMTASGAVTNPFVYLYETGQRIQIGTEDNPYVMQTGNKITVDTNTGKKSVILNDGGIETKINNRIDPESEFFQFRAGINTVGYNADSGVEYLNVRIEYKMRYLGV